MDEWMNTFAHITRHQNTTSLSWHTGLPLLNRHHVSFVTTSDASIKAEVELSRNIPAKIGDVKGGLLNNIL